MSSTPTYDINPDDDGVEVIAQQNVGPEGSEGGGEWPDPRTPPKSPAPGAVDDD